VFAGYPTAELIEQNLHLDKDIHVTNTVAISLEIPSNGRIMPFGELVKIASLARKHGLLMHLGLLFIPNQFFFSFLFSLFAVG
jgi:threonine aldolase